MEREGERDRKTCKTSQDVTGHGRRLEVEKRSFHSGAISWGRSSAGTQTAFESLVFPVYAFNGGMRPGVQPCDLRASGIPTTQDKKKNLSLNNPLFESSRVNVVLNNH